MKNPRKTKPAPKASPPPPTPPASIAFYQPNMQVGQANFINGPTQITINPQTINMPPAKKTPPAKPTRPSASQPPAPAAPVSPALFAESSPPDRLYVVFCRIVGLKSLPADQLAAAQQVLLAVAEAARQTPDLEVFRVNSSVYGRFLSVRNPVPALRAAEQVLDEAARRGVHLAIGLTVGRLEWVDDLAQRNVIGPAINLAARLAAQDKADDKIVLAPEVMDAVCQAAAEFPRNSFTGPHDGKVKRTEFKYYLRLHTAPRHGPLPPAGKFRTFDAHAVVFDIVRFSEKTADEQWQVVTELRRLVLSVIEPLGGKQRASQEQLWHAPAGDGGALVFSAEQSGGDTAWLFARELAQHCRGQVEIRLGLATGSVVVLPGQLPVGPGILRADSLCGHPPSWGWCVNRAFWEGRRAGTWKHWVATPLPDDADALLLAPVQPTEATANPE